MDKISSLQFMALLICSKLFSVMTFIPDRNENGATFTITVIVATALLGLLIIPALAFYKKNNGESILTFSGSKSRGLSVVISGIYLIITLFALIKIMGDLAFFLQYCFSDIYAPWAVIIVIAAVTFYISGLSISTLARTTGIVVTVTFIGLALVLSGFHHHIDFIELNLAVENPTAKILSGIPRILSDSYELIAFVLLMQYLRKQSRLTVYGYLSVKAVIISITVLAVTLVLGNYALMTKLPFFALSAFSQTRIIEHFEAFFMLFWTLCAIVKLVLFTQCAGICLKELFPDLKDLVGKGAVLAISSAVTIPLLVLQKWEAVKFINLQAILIVIGIFVIPLIMLVFRKRSSSEGGR